MWPPWPFALGRQWERKKERREGGWIGQSAHGNVRSSWGQSDWSLCSHNSWTRALKWMSMWPSKESFSIDPYSGKRFSYGFLVAPVKCSFLWLNLSGNSVLKLQSLCCVLVTCFCGALALLLESHEKKWRMFLGFQRRSVSATSLDLSIYQSKMRYLSMDSNISHHISIYLSYPCEFYSIILFLYNSNCSI